MSPLQTPRPPVFLAAMEQLAALSRTLSPRRRRQFALALLLMLVGAVAELITIGAALPFLALIAVPEQITHYPFLARWVDAIGGDPVLAASLLLAAAAVAAAVIRVLLGWFVLRFATAVGHDLAVGIFSRMLRQPYAVYVQRGSSEILSGVEKVQYVVRDVLQPGMQGLTSSVIAVAIIVLLCLINVVASLAAAAFVTAIYGLTTLATRGRLRRNSRILSESATVRIKVVQEGMGGIRDVILDRSQAVFEDTFARADARYRRAQSFNTFAGTAPRYAVEAAGIVAISLIAWVMSRGPGGIVAAIPMLGALALGAQRLLPLLHQTYSGFSTTIGNFSLVSDIVALMQAPVLADDAPGEPLPFARAIRFDAVGYRHPEGSFALEGASFEIARGARIGVVGPTGSGKSTLLDILMGLLEPDAGAVLIDGHRLDSGSLHRWRAQIAHVPQAVYLADDTILANIAFGMQASGVDQARIRAVLETAQLAAFVDELPLGLETRVGERGIRLSGGQRQRIGIARALYKRAPVLILDEATNALDDATETAVIQAIMALGPDITIVMIAHRTSTLAGCDRLIRLRDGKVVES
ncbi:MAG TPA: ABC transporter ATP-binding protein [Allosphingosinicella sp.]|nr:ABC transporter ATP-binding protein [Allosphingosinicella sp.]